MVLVSACSGREELPVLEEAEATDTPRKRTKHRVQRTVNLDIM